MGPLELADTLCGVRRIGWLQRGVADAEDLCRHTMAVVFIAAELASRAGLDVARAVAAAAIHEVAEAFLGHASRLLRDLVGWEEVERGVVSRYLPHLAPIFEEYRRGDGVGLVVQIADKLATAVRACSYAALGYPTRDLAEAMAAKALELASRAGLTPAVSEMLEKYCGGDQGSPHRGGERPAKPPSQSEQDPHGSYAGG